MAAGFGGGGDHAAEIELPHDAMIHTRRSPKAAGGAAEGYFESTDCEYTKQFRLEEKDQVCYLEFDGVYRNASILVNGEYVGRHCYGYGNFLLRIDGYLNAEQENSVKVIVRNGTGAHSRWYSGQGIYRDVMLHTGSPLHIPPYGVRITTITADEQIARLKIETDVRWEGKNEIRARLVHVLKDSDGNQIHESETAFSIRSGEILKLEKTVYIQNPALWSTETPNMYLCESRILTGETEADSAEADFGIRHLDLDPVFGLRINGKAIKLKGGCIHHDNGLLGAVSSYGLEYRRIKKLKEAGYNAVRSAHNPMSSAMLKACDSLGMLVMDELADMWLQSKVTNDYSNDFENNWERDVEDMVRKVYNHPSVIMYSIGNEIPETGTSAGARMGRRIAEKYRSLDPTRYITNSINFMMAVIQKIGPIMQSVGMNLAQEGYAPDKINDLMSDTTELLPRIAVHPDVKKAVEESLDFLDIIGINYASSVVSEYHREHPDWMFVGSETFPKNLSENWALVEKHPYLLGDFSWTAWDYLGESGLGRIADEKSGGTLASMGNYPWLTADTGDFDITGFRKPVSYWRELFFNQEKETPYICVTDPAEYGKDLYRSQWSFTNGIHSWTWEGQQGKETLAEVFSNAEEAELYINGQSQGRLQAEKQERKNYYSWICKYTPGTIEVITYKNQNEIGRDMIQTVKSGSSKIRFEPEQLVSDLKDSAYVILNIMLKDEAGTLDMSHDRSLEICVEGDGKLLAFGSANPRTEEGYDSNVCKMYHGRAQAILLKKVPGTVEVRVTSEGLPESSITV